MNIVTRKLKLFSLCTFLAALSIILSGCSSNDDHANITTALLRQLPASTQQVLLVNSHSWNDSSGELQRYEKKQNQWQKIGKPYPVMLGRNGTAWGTGLHKTKGLKNFKQEGDGKAPAGVFKLATSFGYADAPAKQQSYPYKQATDRDYYIDDVESTDYNHWVKLPAEQANTPKAHWKSFERMRRDDHLYEWGIEIEHNKHPIKKKGGSAIFMHVWKDNQTTTAGCTAMAKNNLLTILEWLDASKQPLLIQAPIQELKNIKL